MNLFSGRKMEALSISIHQQIHTPIALEGFQNRSYCLLNPNAPLSIIGLICGEL
jgi:hypothetical protein